MMKQGKNFFKYKQSALIITLLFSAFQLRPDLTEISGEKVFYENFEIGNGSSLSVKLDSQVPQPLESIRSPYQKIAVYQTQSFGKMLVIDDTIMLTEYDNFAYHEMISHVPLIAHPHPKRVLIVGGGDGGVAQQVLKHAEVEEVVLCDIDQKVIDVSQKYFPELATCFDDPRLIVIAEDAGQYIKTKENYFDVICVDSTDPIGPGEILFKRPFYEDMHRALTEDGIAVTQSESMYYHRDLIAKLNKQNKELFEYASYYFTMIPTYPSGTIGFSFCSKKYDPFEKLDEVRISLLSDLEYYHKNIHFSSFTLPAFMQERLH